MKRALHRFQSKSIRKGAITLVLVGIGLLSIVAALELTNTTYWLHHKRIIHPRTAGPDTKGEMPVSTEQLSDQQKSSGQTTKLVVPYGNFVSNHRPNLDGSPAPNMIQSTCTTTPGATCTIIFIKDGATKSLTEQKTDSGGAAYWSWTLQDLGIGEGTWQIEARATLGDQTETAQDTINLQVSP